MSITYELRKWANEHLYKSGIKSDLLTIADRIDEAHFNALVGRSEIGVQAVLSDPEQYGLTALPKDADGEVIHIGDVMEWIDLDGETLRVKGIGNGVLFYIDGEGVKWTIPRNKRHYHAPTVEDVTCEFLQDLSDWLGLALDIDYIKADGMFAEFAAKLRLANDGEEQ